LSYVGAALGIGAIAPNPATLVIADVIARFVNSTYLAIWSIATMRWIWQPARWQTVRSVAHRYREYPFVSVPGTLINVVGGILTPIMIYATFDANASGQYGLLERSLSLPLGLVIVSVSQVFTSQFAASFREDRNEAVRAFNKIVKVMAAAGLAPVIVLVLAGPFLFALVFGEQWRTAGELARIMAPAYWSMLIVGTVNMVVTVVGYQKTQTAWEIGRLAAMAALWLMVPRLGLSLHEAVLGHAAVTIVCNLGFVLLAGWALRHAGSKERLIISDENARP
jgi:O-antigen/teichoic acid export membrane protein